MNSTQPRVPAVARDRLDRLASAWQAALDSHQTQAPAPSPDKGVVVGNLAEEMGSGVRPPHLPRPDESGAIQGTPHHHGQSQARAVPSHHAGSVNDAPAVYCHDSGHRAVLNADLIAALLNEQE